MSKENVKKFYEAVVADEGLRTRLSDISKQYQGETMDEEKSAELVEKLILPIASEMGLEFTIEELRQYEQDLGQANVNRELDSNELDAVAGGLSGGACIIVGVTVGGSGFCFGPGVIL
ncbi:Nitrogen fixation protein of unknown function [Desulfotomaculum arcticum]|uniref:Nif11 domain-containing protein n=1 Tax=Desulfotruncus arcticus DSM 17038 TaxID=1121424 RepID=A0A1I2PB03_9FIRM|nr:Nif11-like leader peptide family natural product precursor [Desulfotruncus arcticus]SFG13315.1 Nitrogen fixation protein of unknown function [Desulfotomaculum arcticum] [Desulfotruncus arcticus DSM 17038]